MSIVRETGTYLDRILAQTAEDMVARRKSTNFEELGDRIEMAPPPADVRPALQRDTIAVIAEIKKASPSKGTFPVAVDPAGVAREYIAGGVGAISCLTDEPFFKGSLADLEAVAGVALNAEPAVPVLRKDFVIDTFQIDEARACGASMALLIVAALDDRELRDFREYAESLGMQALVEVHDEEESQRAVASGASVVGINNRDLRTFEVDLANTERLAPGIPADAIIIGESGIFTTDHVARLAGSGIDAVLVGESLILQDDRARAVREIAGVERVR